MYEEFLHPDIYHSVKKTQNAKENVFNQVYLYIIYNFKSTRLVINFFFFRCQLVDFHRPTSPNGSHPELFTWVLNYFKSYDEFKPPLYLQHQGIAFIN